MKIVVVGLGKVGYDLSKTLLEHGHKISAIEQNEELCRKVANDLGHKVICGDGTRIEIQTLANVEKADVFIAVTGKDEINLIACQIAKMRFGSKKTVARVNNPKNLSSMQQLGVDIAVSSTGFISNLIERQLDDADTRFLATVMSGQISINELVISKGSAFENKMVKELSLPTNCILVSVLRNGKMIIPRGNVMLHRDDAIVAACPPENKAEVLAAFRAADAVPGEAES